jgi:O-antigen/teichoic acid export membrane protein
MLARAAALAIGASVLATTAIRLVSLASTFILARLLIPADFGIASLGLLVILFLTPLTDIGIAQALVRGDQGDLAHRARTAFWLVNALGWGMYAVLFIGAGPVASFYRQPEVAPMLRVIVLAVPIYAVSRIPSALLERRLSFGRKMIPEILGSFVNAVVAVGLAYLHFGFWSIVGGTLFRYGVVSIGTFAIAGWRPSLTFDRAVAQELIAYARYLMAGSIFRLAYTNVDNALVGKVLGVAALGFYSMSYTLANLVALQISDPVGRVLFPTYSRLLSDRLQTARALRLALRYVSLVISPVTILGIVAMPVLLPLVLGSKWLPALVPIQILMAYGWARALAPVYWASMLAADLNLASLRINFVSLAAALIVAFPAAIHFGILGVAASFAALELIRFGWMGQITARYLGYRLHHHLAAILPGLVGSTLAGGVLWLLIERFQPRSFVGMCGALAGAGFLYAATLVLLGDLRPERIRRALQVLTSGRRWAAVPSTGRTDANSAASDASITAPPPSGA